MNYDQVKAIEELDTAICMIKMGMYSSAKKNIGWALDHLKKAQAPPAVTASNDFSRNPNKR